MRCSVSQAWICDRVGSNYTSLVCGTAAISAAAAASLLAYSRRGRLDRTGRGVCPGGKRRHGKTNRCVGTAHSRRGGLERLPQRRWCKDAEFSASPAPLAGRSRYLLDIDPQLTGFHPRKV